MVNAWCVPAGCPAAAARAITEAVLASPVCRVANITISSRIPVADLAGRWLGPGQPPPPTVIDLASGGGGGPGAGRGGGAAAMEVPLTDEDAEVVAAALRARVAAEAAAGEAAAPPLSSLTLPASCNDRLGRAAVEGLVEAMAALPGLQRLNGVPLAVSASAAVHTVHSTLPQLLTWNARHQALGVVLPRSTCSHVPTRT